MNKVMSQPPHEAIHNTFANLETLPLPSTIHFTPALTLII